MSVGRIVLDASAALHAVLPGPGATAVLARREGAAVLTADRAFAEVLEKLRFPIVLVGSEDSPSKAGKRKGTPAASRRR
ncbi:MAG TPA: hypothetical protein VF580_01315 [Thermoanaerobaculia bacterium]